MSYGALGLDCPPGGVPDPTGLFCVPSGVLTSGGGKFSCPPGSQVDPSGTMCLPIPAGTPGETGKTTSGGITEAKVPLPGGLPTDVQSWLSKMPGASTTGTTSPSGPSTQAPPAQPVPDLTALIASLYGVLPQPGQQLVAPTKPPEPRKPSPMSSPWLWAVVSAGAIGLGWYVYSSSSKEG